MVPTWLGILVALVVLVGFIGSVVVFLRGSKDAGTIQTLERSNKALAERVSLLEANEARLTARVGLLERENADLHAQRPSAEVLIEIRMLLGEVHTFLLGGEGR